VRPDCNDVSLELSCSTPFLSMSAVWDHDQSFGVSCSADTGDMEHHSVSFCQQETVVTKFSTSAASLANEHAPATPEILCSPTELQTPEAVLCTSHDAKDQQVESSSSEASACGSEADQSVAASELSQSSTPCMQTLNKQPTTSPNCASEAAEARPCQVVHKELRRQMLAQELARAQQALERRKKYLQLARTHA
jgi:hypothetical protein